MTAILNFLSDALRVCVEFLVGLAETLISFVETINPFFWIGANVLIVYVAVLVVAFVIMYSIFFDPKATTAGRMIFRFMLSLVGVIGLVFIGVFIDPAAGRQPFGYNATGVDWWRPALRFLIYGYVAFSITLLAGALVMRKWFPDKVKKKSDLALVKPRNDTSEIPIL